jgi:hypothetical protein
MADVVNTNVFVDKKFVDFAGLDYFWEKAKAYVDAQDNAISARVAVNEAAVSTINKSIETLTTGLGNVAGQIDAAVAPVAADVAALKAIDHEAYKTADTNLETSIKGFVADNYDAKDTAKNLVDAHAGDAVADDRPEFQLHYGLFRDLHATHDLLPQSRRYPRPAIQAPYQQPNADLTNSDLSHRRCEMNCLTA